MFKFGSKITVETSDPDGTNIYEFKLNSKEIENYSSITGFHAKVNQIMRANFKGTEIIVEDLHHEAIELFKKSMKDEGEYTRLSNLINDNKFTINIQIDDQPMKNDKEATNKFKAAKIAEFKYSSRKDDSINKKFELIIDGNKKFYSIPDEYDRLIQVKGFKIIFDIDIYSFKHSVKVKDAPKLYYYSKWNRIKPLIYVNDSIFDDEDLYNIEINASKKGSYVYRQQTGKILIYLDNSNILDFNADRTKINDSINYEDLKSLTNFLSARVQTTLNEVLRHGDDNTNKKKDSSIPESKKIDSDENIDNDENINKKPTAKLLKDKIKVAKLYRIDDLVETKDSTGGYKVAPEDLKSSPGLPNVLIDNKNNTIIFYRSGNYELSFDFKDKTNGEENHFSESITVESTKSNRENPNTLFIESYIDESKNLDPIILKFKGELQSLYELNYDMVLVSSTRTFVELVARDIAKKIKYRIKGKSLKEIVKDITEENKVQKNIFDKFKSQNEYEIELKSIEDIYKIFCKNEKIGPIVDKLNLCTHVGPRYLHKKDVEDELLNINFLYTYLNFVS